MLNGEVFHVPGVGPGTTVATLKEKLEALSKVPRGKQRLFCGGICVEVSRSLCLFVCNFPKYVHVCVLYLQP